MPLKDTLQRYELVTLALSQAFVTEDWQEATALINERENLLVRLTTIAGKPQAKELARLATIDDALVAGLKTELDAIAMQIGASQRQRTKGTAYHTRPTTAAFERSG